MKKPTILIIGTRHIGKKFEREIKDSFQNYKPDLFLCEGVQTKKHWLRNMKKEPVIIFVTYFYGLLLKVFGKDRATAEKLSARTGVPLVDIDITLTEMTDIFHKWYTPFFAPVLMSLSSLLIYMHWQSGVVRTILIILAIALVAFMNFAIFVLLTKKTRDKAFIENADKYMKKRKAKKGLLICGKTHADAVAMALTEKYDIKTK